MNLKQLSDKQEAFKYIFKESYDTNILFVP